MRLFTITRHSTIKSNSHKKGRIRTALIGTILTVLILGMVRFEITRFETTLIKSAAAHSSPQVIDCNFNFDPIFENALED